MKKVLVTGGTRGIGRAICEAFARKGYVVYAAYSSDEEAAADVRKMGITPVRVDVSDEADVKKLFEKIGGYGVDILVNNAGRALIKQVQDVSARDWKNIFGVNTDGAFYCIREAVKGMIDRQAGLIVNISSVWGEVGGSCESAYSASKAALIGFTKALAKELGWSKIRVNCVSPGVIDTQMNACFSAEERAALLEEIPLGRMGRAEEIAETVLFLEENEYVTGADIPVNGGFSIV